MPKRSITPANLPVPNMRLKRQKGVVTRPITDHPPIIQNTRWGAMATMNILHPGSPLSPTAQVDGVTALPKEGKEQMELTAEYIYKMFKEGVGCLALQEVPDPSSDNFKHLINKLKELDSDSNLIDTDALASQWQKTGKHAFGTSMLYNPKVFTLSKDAEPVLNNRGSSYELTHNITGEKVPVANLHGDYEKQADTIKFINGFNGVCVGDANVSNFNPSNNPDTIQSAEKPTVQINGQARTARTFDIFQDNISRKFDPNFTPNTTDIVKSPGINRPAFKSQIIKIDRTMAKNQFSNFVNYLKKTNNHDLIQNGWVKGMRLSTPKGSKLAQISITNPRVYEAYEKFRQSTKKDSTLSSITPSSTQGKSAEKKLTLNNPYGNNYVTNVDVLSNGYRINGLNCRGEPRSIIIDKAGNPRGYHNKTLTPAEKQMYRERKSILAHFNIDTAPSLTKPLRADNFSSKKPVSLQKFTLENPYGNNYVTSVEALDGGYKINGINCRGEPRSLIIDKNGNLHGHSKGKLTVVEIQMFENKDKIIAHFLVNSTANKIQQPNLMAQNPTVDFVNQLNHHAAVHSAQTPEATNSTQLYRLQIATVRTAINPEIIIQAASKMIKALQEPANNDIQFSSAEIKALRSSPLENSVKDFEKNYSLPQQFIRDEAQANNTDELNFSSDLQA